MKKLLATIGILCTCAATAVQAGENTIYGGVGTSSAETPKGYGKIDVTPWSMGWLHTEKPSPLVLGLDYSREGFRYDSTWGQRSVRLSNSYNVLIGTNIFDHVVRLDAAAIIGTREVSANCPMSYIGYQCWAGRTPDIKYEFNYGGLLALSYQNVVIGVRVTSTSNQMIFGVRF